MNKVFLSGRVVKDIVIKHFNQNNMAIVNVIAVKRPYSKDKTDFIPFQIWGEPVKIFEKYVNKGDMVTLVGSLITNQYKNLKGETIYSYNINVVEFELTPKGNKEVYEDGKPKVNEGEKPHDAKTLPPESLEKGMEDYGIASFNGEGDLPF